jgi:hypothetical protein
MKDYVAFREAIGKRESGGRYDCLNKFGFLGKYQFGKPRLYDLGYSIDGWKPKFWISKTVISTYEFLNNRVLQDNLFEKHANDYKKFAMRKLEKYIGMNYNGNMITLSGLIAGAHLMGWGNKKNPGVIQFCKEGIISKDGLGTPITEYLVNFSGYEV